MNCKVGSGEVVKVVDEALERYDLSSNHTMRRDKRIGILLTVPHLRPTASPYREIIGIAKYRPANRFDLTVCSLRPAGFEQTAPLLRSYGVECFVARFRPRGHSLRHLVECLKEQGRIERYGPFDIQHSLDFTASFIEAVVAKTSGRKYGFSQRNMNLRGHKLALRLKAALADRIIAISGGTKALMLQLGARGEKVSMIYPGMDLDEIPTVDSGRRILERDYILSVGQIVRLKRHEDAIEAFATVSETDDKLELVVVGEIIDEVYYEELKRRVVDLHLEDKVKFLGGREDVLLLMRDAKLLVHTAESEAFGWVVLEAMATGIPIVAAASEGPTEIIEHGKTGYLVGVGDISGYVQAMRPLLTESEESRVMRRRAMARAIEGFSAEESVRRIYRQFADMLPGPVSVGQG